MTNKNVNVWENYVKRTFKLNNLLDYHKIWTTKHLKIDKN